GGRMKTGLSQHTSLRQELRVNPRLYQAMDMLYMPMMDLQQHLKQELLANPFLELLEPEDETPEQKDSDQEKEQKEKEEEMDWEEILLNGFEVGGTREQYEQLEYTEPVTVETKDLIDYLREQLQMMTLTPRQLLLAEEFLGNINDEGYLAASLEEIVGSVNQLVAGHVSGEGEGGEEGEGEERRGDGEPVEGKDAAEATPSSAPFYTTAEAEEMLAGMPRLRLSRSYQEIARDKKKMTPENREFIASKMNSANWMIQAIEQRRQTMLKVMNFIVDRQREFFEKGIEHLRPLTLREVAEV